MSTKPIRNRQTGLMMSGITLFAGVTGFVYQFIPDGTFLTLFVCIEAVLGLVSIGQGLDERESQLLLRSYGTAFKYLFGLILILYFLIYVMGLLNFAGPLVALINSHWIGIIISTMCIFLGVA